MRPVFYQRRWEPNLGLSRHTIYRILFWLLAAFVAYRVFLFGQGIYDSRAAAQLAQTATSQLAAGQKDLAIETLRIAFTHDESNPDAARVMARMLDAEEAPLAVEYHRIVTESGKADAEDHRRLALSAARHGDGELARSAAAKNRELGGDPAFPDLIEAKILASKGDSAGREKALRAALSHKESGETLMALADFLLSDSELYDLNAAEASRLLRRAAAIDKGPTGLQALRRGLVSGALPPGDFTTLLQMYRSHPAASTDSRLDSVEIEWAANPALRPAIVSQAAKAFQSQPKAERTKAARWFFEKGEPRAAMEALPYPLAAAGPKSLRVWIDSAVAVGDWKALETALQSPSPAIDDAVRLPLLARSLKQQGRAAESAAINAKALKRFESNPEKLSEVLSGLLAAGEWELFENNILPVVNNPQTASSALRAWVPLAREQRSSAKLLGFYEKAISSPHLARDPYLLDRLMFCRLILGIPVPIEEVEPRSAMSSDNPNYLATTALGYLKNGRRAKALYLIEGGGSPVDFSKMTPSRQAAVAAVFAANDRTVEARRIAEGIPRGKLTVEEEAFLNNVLAKGALGY